MRKIRKNHIDIVVPCFNEAECVPLLYKTVEKLFAEHLPQYGFSVIFVDDGSKDGTMDQIHALAKAKGDDHVQFVSFARNFGKEAAMFAGFEKSSAELVAVMDADLQHPPTLLVDMVKAITEEGFDCAAARRVSRTGEGKIKSFFSQSFYYVINWATGMHFVPGMTDYRLMKRSVVDAIVSMKERERFLKGIYSWVGFKTKWIAYENVERAAGTSKWSFGSLLSYAKLGIIAFAATPLRGVVWLGMFVVVISFLYFLRVVYQTQTGAREWLDTTTIILLMLFLGGVIITILGLIGEYLARIYMEVKNRPIYIARETNIGEVEDGEGDEAD